MNTWSAAVKGNVLLFGGDSEVHAGPPIGAGGSSDVEGAKEFIRQAIRFAANDDQPGPGLYIAFAAVEPDEVSSINQQMKAIQHLLSGFGSFTPVHGPFDQVQKINNHPFFSDLTNTDLSGWGQSSHIGFTSWPTGFVPLAMTTDASLESRTPFGASTPGFPLNAAGLVHILIREPLVLSPFTAGRLVGQQHSVTATFTPQTEIVFDVISGPNASLGPVSLNTGSSGSVTWTYTGSGGVGRDVIRATIGTSPNFTAIAEVTVDWANQLVTMTATDRTAVEPASSGAAANTGTFTITRSSASGTLNVNVRLSGSALSGSDYTHTTIPVAFASGQLTRTITITPVFDNVTENLETVFASLLPDTASPITYAVGSPSQDTVTISGGQTGVSFVSATASISEGATSPLTVTLQRSSTVGELQVPISFSGSASFGADYDIEDAQAQFQHDGTLFFPDGDATTTFSFIPIPDSRAETSGEIATISLVAQGNYSLGSTPQISITITDDDTVQIPANGWKLTDLGTMGGTAIRAFAINTIPDGSGGWRGKVVGNYDTSNNTNPYLGFLYDNGSSSVLWPHPFTNYVQSWSHAFSINDASRIVGGSSFYYNYGYPPSYYYHFPCLWQPGQTSPILLPLLDNPHNAENVARDINNQNVVIGAAVKSDGKVHAVAWIPDVNGAYTFASDLMDLGSGDRTSYAFAINDWGDYVGRSQLASGNQFHAFRAEENPSDFDDFPETLDPQLHGMGTGTFFDIHQSEGNDINNLSELVGASQMPSGQYRAAYKTPFSAKNQGWYDLGVLGQGTSAGNQSKALGINDKGLIVGWSYLNVSGVMRQRAFVVSNTGDLGSQPMLDLNSHAKVFVAGLWQPASVQGWTLEAAHRVNNANWIVGFGTKSGTVRAFVLSPL